MSDANVLWLPAWFPARTDFLPGDFTHRHAIAVSRFVKITVLYVTKDASLAVNAQEEEVEQQGNLCIYRGYYNVAGEDALSKIKSVKTHLQLLWRLYKKAQQEQGSFKLVHVHISLRQGLLAQWLRWRHGIPYVITEQNAVFMPVANKAFPTSALQQKIMRSNFKNAAAIHVVSASLGNALQERYGFIKNFTVIPNVVDTNLFFPQLNKEEPIVPHFFTVTSDVYHKNTDGIVRAFAQYIKAGNAGRLTIAGPNYEPLLQMAAGLAVREHTDFLGAVAYTTIAQKMREADALLFFTRYETFGCVMAEALCCGTPVIASKIPVLQENLQEGANALFVEPENEAALAEAMAGIQSQKNIFDRESIASQARKKYHYNRVGQTFVDFYKTVVPGL